MNVEFAQLPSGETIILSNPFGPKDVRIVSAICLAAKICDWKQYFNKLELKNLENGATERIKLILNGI